MDKNKIIKFKDFTTNEDTYKVNDDGKIEKQEWELYKDWHPAKFKVSNLTKKSDTTPFETGEFVWVIKKDDIIVSIFSSKFSENKIEKIFNILKEEENIDDDSNNSDNNVNEKEDSDL